MKVRHDYQKFIDTIKAWNESRKHIEIRTSNKSPKKVSKAFNKTIARRKRNLEMRARNAIA